MRTLSGMNDKSSVLPDGKIKGGEQMLFSSYSRFHFVRSDVNREIRNCCCAAKRKSNVIAYMIDDVEYGISGYVSLL